MTGIIIVNIDVKLYRQAAAAIAKIICAHWYNCDGHQCYENYNLNPV